MKKYTRSVLVVAVFALLAGQVGAQMININFARWDTPGVNVVATGPGQGVLDDSETIGAWNNPFRTGTVTNIIDSASNTTAVVVNVGLNGTWQGADVTPAVLNDYLFINSGSATNILALPIVFSNLTASATYQIAFMGQADNVATDARFTIDGTSKTITPVDLNSGVWQEGENYVLFEDVQADAEGVITGEWSNVSAQYAALSGIQIEKISVAPPPPIEIPVPVMTCGGTGPGGMMITAGNLLATNAVRYEVQGTPNLLADPIDWTTLMTTSGVSSADFTLPMTEPNQFFRIKGEEIPAETPAP